jgi:hypothetical protein
LFVCVVNFPVVPTGKRLVVTYASASYSLSAGGALQDVQIGADGNTNGDYQHLTTSNVGINRIVAGTPITYYVDAGHNPSLFLTGEFIGFGFGADATIAGYLVSVP